MSKQVKILLVDDNQELAKNIQDILEEKGYTAMAVFDGKSAAELCREEPFDIVLVDYKLPDMNGLELQEQLSELISADYIIITGYGSLESATEAVKRKQIVGYETKPLEMGRVLAFIQQIADRRAAQAQIRFQSRLLESVGQAVIATDSEGYITYMNRAAEKLYGWSREEVMGYSVVEIVVSDTCHEEAIKIMDKLKAGQIWAGEFTVRHRTGREFPVYVTDTPVMDEQGHLEGIIGISADITERKQMEEQIRESLREKEILLSEIHHRVKNNLMIVTSLIRRQSAQTDNPQAVALLRDLHNRVMAMSMIHQSLYQSGSFADIDFRVYLERLIAGIKQGFALASVSVRVIAEDINLEIGKAIPCGMLVAELGTNIFKHAFPQSFLEGTDRSPEIAVEMRKQEGIFRLIVSDNGVGMPQDFDWRNSRTSGMALARGWAEHQLEGTLEIESENGTRVVVTFPDD